MTNTYLSSDDSRLLREAMRSYKGKICVEIGIGYGSNLIELENRFEELVGTDIRHVEGFEFLRTKTANLFITDRTTCFRNQIFDLVITNPPYLPSTGVIDETVDGGMGGFDVPMQFLQEALRVVHPSGAILILLSNETSAETFNKFCADNHLRVKVISERTLFFEKLTVYELRKTEIRSDLTVDI